MTEISDERLLAHIKAGGLTHDEVDDLLRELLSRRAAGAEPVAWCVDGRLRDGSPIMYLPFLTSREDMERYQRANPDVRLKPLYTSPPASAPGVKELEWCDNLDESGSAALSPFGAWYFVNRVEGGWKMHYGDTPVVASMTEAKAAAQSDYETRIRSALLSTIKEPTDGN